MIRMMAFAALTVLPFLHSLAEAGEKVVDSQVNYEGAYRTLVTHTLLLAQNANTSKDAAKVQTVKPTKRISEDEAKQIAEKTVPGKAIDVAIENKRGANRFVVEVAPAAGGKEVDVIIDMTSGKVLGIEK